MENQPNQQSPDQTQNDQKKPFYKKGWFIAVVVVVILYSIGNSSFEEASKKAEEAKNDTINESTVKKDTTDNKQEAEQTKEEVKLTDEEKQKLKDFYEKAINYPNKADEAYKLWTDKLENSSTTQAYLDLDQVKSNYFNVWQGYSDMKIPEVNIAKDDKKKIKDGISELSTAYFTKKEAMESMQSYLNKNDLEKLSEAKKDMQLAGNFVLSGIAKIMEVMMKYEVEIIPESNS